jgi:hypothetical protein
MNTIRESRSQIVKDVSGITITRQNHHELTTTAPIKDGDADTVDANTPFDMP